MYTRWKADDGLVHTMSHYAPDDDGRWMLRGRCGQTLFFLEPYAGYPTSNTDDCLTCLRCIATKPFN